MRQILIDWLVEVAEEYDIALETLLLAKNYIDRYLSVRPLRKGRLQLLGITALLVASKYEVMIFFFFLFLFSFFLSSSSLFVTNPLLF